MTRDESCAKAEEILGMCGRLLCGSKSAYFNTYPENEVVFNANVCTKAGKVWYGDLDVTRDGHMLRILAEALGEKIFVLREHDARFDNETAPKLDKAVASF